MDILTRLEQELSFGSHVELIEKNGYKILLTKESMPFAIVEDKEPDSSKINDIYVDFPEISMVIVMNDNIKLFYIKDSKLHFINEKILPFRKSVSKDVDSNNFERFLFSLHSIVRDVDGIHADLVLDELCKVILSKIYMEKSGLQISVDGLNKFECYSMLNGIYRNACVFSNIGIDDNINLTPSCLIEVYSKVESVDFTSLPFDLKGRMFQNLISSSLRSGMGQYFTPHEVIDLIVRCIDPKANELIIDPFCGSGHFLIESAKYLGKLNDDFYLKNNIYGIEKNSRIYRIAMTDMVFNTGVTGNFIHSDSLLSYDQYNINLRGEYDIVMTNPPFGSLLSADSLLKISHFELLTGRKNIPLEILGIERSVELLKDGGRLGIVVPDSILTNKSHIYVRDWMRSKLRINAVISLPIETFSPYGASVKTSIVIATKVDTREKVNTSGTVFLAGVESVGYDATGKNKKESDILDVVNKFKLSMESK